MVTIDEKPVLRCIIQREALRYAVMIRRALRQPGRKGLPMDGADPRK